MLHWYIKDYTFPVLNFSVTTLSTVHCFSCVIDVHSFTARFCFTGFSICGIS